MKKKILFVLLLAAIVLVMAACANYQSDNQAAFTQPSQTSEPAQTQTQPTAAQPSAVPMQTIPTASDADAAVKEAYRAALNDFVSNHTFPDGTECAFDDANDISGDTFAIYDVDGDSRDELLIVHTVAPMAGQVHYVFDYDSDANKFVAELNEFPMLTFYDNGVVKAGWSHNQGLGGDFWPFSVYKYDGVSDTYKLVGMIDAWDKQMADEDYDGNKYPDDIDVSGSGFVYYIMVDGECEKAEPVDVTEFNKWCQENMGDGVELEIVYSAMTVENIAGIK